MSAPNRRRFLTALAATVLAGVGVARYSVGVPARTLSPAARPVPAPLDRVGSVPVPPAPSSPGSPGAHIPLPGGGTLRKLPGHADLLALTVDDGVNTDVVRLYTQFAADTGMRLTYFVTGSYRSWTDNRAALRPLVDSGQIQLGNHTWSHPYLTTLSTTRIAEELSRNHQFLRKTYGVDATPYFRPPYGKHNATVDSVAADVGYTVPTLWSGSLADSTVVTEDYIVEMAHRYFTAQTIVIGHLNHLPVTHVYPRLLEIIRARNLRAVTLKDVFVSDRISAPAPVR
jgi:peptidoglycan-N-acetylglucosamine deacetylase